MCMLYVQTAPLPLFSHTAVTSLLVLLPHVILLWRLCLQGLQGHWIRDEVCWPLVVSDYFQVILCVLLCILNSFQRNKEGGGHVHFRWHAMIEERYQAILCFSPCTQYFKCYFIWNMTSTSGSDWIFKWLLFYKLMINIWTGILVIHVSVFLSTTSISCPCCLQIFNLSIAAPNSTINFKSLPAQGSIP